MNKGIYQDKKSGKWYISTKIQGKTCTIRGYNSKREADLDYPFAIEKWKREHNLEKNSMLFYEEVRDKFFEYRKRQVREESVRKDITQFNTYWNVVYAHQTIKSIFMRQNATLVYERLINDKLFNQRKKCCLIRSFLEFAKYCYVTKLIGNETYQDIVIIFQRVKDVKSPMHEKRVIPNADLEKLISVIDQDHPDYPMFRLFIYLGCRISEFLGICVDCFDNKITIKRQLLTSGELTDTLKTTASYRKIPIPNDLYELIDLYITNREIKMGRVFRVSHTDFKRKLKRYEELAGIPLYASHEFRHTKCYNLARKCQTMSDVVYCAKIMGHSVNQYLNTYCSHLDESLESKFL